MDNLMQTLRLVLTWEKAIQVIDYPWFESQAHFFTKQSIKEQLLQEAATLLEFDRQKIEENPFFEEYEEEIYENIAALLRLNKAPHPKGWSREDAVLLDALEVCFKR